MPVALTCYNLFGYNAWWTGGGSLAMNSGQVSLSIIYCPPRSLLPLSSGSSLSALPRWLVDGPRPWESPVEKGARVLKYDFFFMNLLLAPLDPPLSIYHRRQFIRESSSCLIEWKEHNYCYTQWSAISTTPSIVIDINEGVRSGNNLVLMHVT